MNEQIKHELESSYIYLSMVAYFHSQNLDGMAHWMRCQVHEETIHAMKFFDHIISRGGAVVLLDLKQLKLTWESPLEAWKDAYAHEQFVTAKIHNLIKIAREETTTRRSRSSPGLPTSRSRRRATRTGRPGRSKWSATASRESSCWTVRWEPGSSWRARPSILRPTTCSSSLHRRQRFNSLLP